ncbi:MAG TPA: ShlB/FhaC/HecB family hemolysin secretion/activation protein [Burkholderiales bacterium]|nr:ShlB/FhaC/HecB family hemolysin secretion/activation protein [Burkholderiales bacterium]
MIAAVLAGSMASAQDFERIAPKPVTPPGQLPREGPREPPRDTTIRVKELKGIVFVTDPKAVRREGVTGVSGLDVSRIPELQTEAFRARMSRYLGKPVSLASIDDLVREVVAFYTEQDRPFVLVSSPEQDITGGVLQLLVVEGRVGEVSVAGARTFSERIYRDALGLKPGDRINKRKLDEDIDWLNRNPFREASVHLEPGGTLGTTDVIVRTRERSPFRLYLGYDDTGTDLTDNKRVLAGINWGNAFGLDHQFNYQLSASPDLDIYRAHSATYIAPLPWRHLLTVFGAYVDTKGNVPTPLALEGNSRQLGLRYEVPLRRIRAYTHSLVGGLDWKRTNNNLEFGGTNISVTGAEILQGVLTYQGLAPDAYGSTSFSASLFHSPGGLTSKNEDINFQTLRAFSEAEYNYFNLQATRITRLPADFSWHASAEIQFADGNLLGSEQLGAGGYSSVRGYDEREANGDEGFLIRNELRTPSYRLGAVAPGKEAHIQLLGFVDYGTVSNIRLLPAERRQITLWSAGLGARFSVDQNVTARLDYGWQLKDSGIAGSPRNGRAHFSLLVSY